MPVPRSEVINGSPSPIPEIRETTTYRKTLRVPSYYGRIFSSLKEQPLRTIYRRKILRVFLNEGFDIEFGGEPHPENPFEIGIQSRSGQFEDYNERYAHVANEAGATMPERFNTPEGILTSETPLVVKKYGNHQGVGKIFLSTQEDKIKFLTGILMRNPHNVLRSKHPEKRLEELMAKIREGKFDDNDFKRLKDGKFSDWIAEEYIETPSDYYASYRILADATGKIHYGLISTSPKEKGFIPKRRRNRKLDLVEHLLKYRNEREILFTSGNSYLYIESPSVISNAGERGKEILLNGTKVEDDTERKILEAHGIDPDNPQIPEHLRELSSKIGVASRLDWPFVGIDFLQQGKGDDAKYYFIESNLGPGLVPEGINLDRNENDTQDKELEMMRRVAASISSNYANYRADIQQDSLWSALPANAA